METVSQIEPNKNININEEQKQSRPPSNNIRSLTIKDSNLNIENSKVSSSRLNSNILNPSTKLQNRDANEASLSDTTEQQIFTVRAKSHQTDQLKHTMTLGKPNEQGS